MTDNPRIRPRNRPATADRAAAAGLHVVRPSVPAPAPRPVLIVLWDGVRMLDIAGPLEVLAVADPAGERSIQTASVGGRNVASVRGPSLGVGVALEDVEGELDTLLVGGGSSTAPHPLTPG